MTRQTSIDPDSIQRAVARTVGTVATLWGYPILEMLRVCKNQTRCRFNPGLGGRAFMDALHYSWLPPLEHEFSGRSTGLLYTTGWLSLAQGARHLAPTPTGLAHGATTLLIFHDMFGDTIAELRADAIPSGGVVLIGPQECPIHQGTDFMLLQCPTELVWLIGRTLADPADPAEGWGHADATTGLPLFRLTGATHTMSRRRPAVVDLWQGESSDPFVDLVERHEVAEELAEAFYGNLCRALAGRPMRPKDQALAPMFRAAGLGPSAVLDWNALPTSTRSGLVLGFEDAARTVYASALTSKGRATSSDTGREVPLERAIRARRGIGRHLLDRVVDAMG